MACCVYMYMALIGDLLLLYELTKYYNGQGTARSMRHVVIAYFNWLDG